jgi:hypothetical protein
MLPVRPPIEEGESGELVGLAEEVDSVGDAGIGRRRRLRPLRRLGHGRKHKETRERAGNECKEGKKEEEGERQRQRQR